MRDNLTKRLGKAEAKEVTLAKCAIRKLKTVAGIVEVQKFLVEASYSNSTIKTHVFDLRLRTPEDPIPTEKIQFETLTDERTGESRTTSTTRRVS